MGLASLPRQIRLVLAAFAIVSAILWMAVYAVLRHHSREGMPAVTAVAAGTVTIIGVIILVTFKLRDRDKDLLVRSMVDFSRHAEWRKAPTRPLRRVL